MNMSFARILLLIILVPVFSCSRNQTEISGTIEGGEGMVIALERLDVNRTIALDTVRIREDGSFSFKFRQEESELYILKNKKGGILNLMLSPGQQVNVSTTLDSFGTHYLVKGSQESENIRLLVEHLDNTREILDSLQQELNTINDPESPQVERIRREYAQAIVKQKRYTIRYLVENMTSLSSAYALYQKYDDENPVLGDGVDLQYFKTVADSLEKYHPNSSLTISLRADIDRKEALFRNATKLEELLELANEESGMLDLSIPDREGTDIALSSLKGKVILVAFWASGNPQSIQSLLQLKPIYHRYHEQGFEIYAISLDNNKYNWMSTIDFNEFGWINVSELSYPDSQANVLYNVSNLPSTFLLNREGEIVAKNLYGRTLETWLDNLI